MSTSIQTSCISDDILALLPHRVGTARLRHIHGVVEVSVALAQRFGVDQGRARLAAAAHDMDRDVSVGKGFALAADWRVVLSTTERRNPALLHGPLSAERLRRCYGVNDRELLHAVRHHTLGAPDFGSLGLILYVADFCEPGRPYLTKDERREILRLDSLEEMVHSIILLAKERFGRMDSATAALLHRVSEE
ncbi:MAG: bis(5'-nucleosyl)-tetraphosphatase (symmetrical) YqeK [Alkalispirochaeta sp.]